MGAPTSYTDSIAEEILDRLSDGETLADICKDRARMPAVRTVYDWKRSNEEFADKFQQARDAGEESIAAKILEIVDEDLPKNTFGSVDGGVVQSRKLRVWARMQIMDRFNPKGRAERETDPTQAIADVLAQLAGRLPG